MTLWSGTRRQLRELEKISEILTRNASEERELEAEMHEMERKQIEAGEIGTYSLTVMNAIDILYRDFYGDHTDPDAATVMNARFIVRGELDYTGGESRVRGLAQWVCKLKRYKPDNRPQMRNFIDIFIRECRAGQTLTEQRQCSVQYAKIVRATQHRTPAHEYENRELLTLLAEMRDAYYEKKGWD